MVLPPTLSHHLAVTYNLRFKAAVVTTINQGCEQTVVIATPLLCRLSYAQTIQKPQKDRLLCLF